MSNEADDVKTVSMIWSCISQRMLSWMPPGKNTRGNPESDGEKDIQRIKRK